MRPVYPDGSYEGTVRPTVPPPYVSMPHEPVDEHDWHVDAACRGMHPDVFFPDFNAVGRPRNNGGNRKDSRSHPLWAEALATCARCPVRDKCLIEGLSSVETRKHGVYGGKIPAERRRMPPLVKCQTCAAMFVAKPNERYCSADCRSEGYREASNRATFRHRKATT